MYLSNLLDLFFHLGVLFAVNLSSYDGMEIYKQMSDSVCKVILSV